MIKMNNQEPEASKQAQNEQIDATKMYQAGSVSKQQTARRLRLREKLNWSPTRKRVSNITV
jgi:hypothetical protein